MYVPTNPSADEFARYLARDHGEVLHRTAPRLTSRWHTMLHTYTSDEFQKVLKAAETNTFVRTLSLQFPVTDAAARLGEEEDSTSDEASDENDDEVVDAKAKVREDEAVAVDRLAALIGSFRRDKVTDLLLWERNEKPIPPSVVDTILDGFSQGTTATKGLKWLALACCPTAPALHRFFERFSGLHKIQLGHKRWPCHIDRDIAAALANYIAQSRKLTSVDWYLRGPTDDVLGLERAAFTYRGGKNGNRGLTVRVAAFPDGYYPDYDKEAMLREVRHLASRDAAGTTATGLYLIAGDPNYDGHVLEVSPIFQSPIPLSSTLTTLAFESCRLPGPSEMERMPLHTFDNITTLKLEDCQVDGDRRYTSHGIVSTRPSPAPASLRELLKRMPNLQVLQLVADRDEDGVPRRSGLGASTNEGIEMLAAAISELLPRLRFLELDVMVGNASPSYPGIGSLLRNCRGSLILNCRLLNEDGEMLDPMCLGLRTLHPSLRELRLRLHDCSMDGADLARFVRSLLPNGTLRVLHLDALKSGNLVELGQALRELLVANRSLRELSFERVSYYALEDVFLPTFEALASNSSLLRLQVKMMPAFHYAEWSTGLVRVLVESLRTNDVLGEVSGVAWPRIHSPESSESQKLLKENRYGRQFVRAYSDGQRPHHLPLSAWAKVYANLVRDKETALTYRFLRAKPGVVQSKPCSKRVRVEAPTEIPSIAAPHGK